MDQSYQQKREKHIMIERKRRDKIAQALDRLKYLVPKSRTHGRLFQLEILENAIEYIQHLQQIVDQPPEYPNDLVYFPGQENVYYDKDQTVKKRKQSWQMDLYHLISEDSNKP
jgi:hypothetical protein